MPLSPARDLLNKIRNLSRQKADCDLILADSLEKEAVQCRAQAEAIEKDARRASDRTLKRAKEDAESLSRRAKEDADTLLAEAHEKARLLREKAEWLFARAMGMQAGSKSQKQEADLLMTYRSSNILFQLPGVKPSKGAASASSLPPLAPSLKKLSPLDSSLEKSVAQNTRFSPSVTAFLRKLRGTIHHIFLVLLESGKPLKTAEICEILHTRFPNEYPREDRKNLYKTVGITLGRYRQGAKAKSRLKHTGLIECPARGVYQISSQIEDIISRERPKAKRKNTPASIQ